MILKKNFFLLFLKGIAMGAADAIPGVSGGTIAFITGIYKELISSIRSFNLQALKLLMQFELKELWKHINGTFLITLLSGILTSIILLLHIILFCLKSYPVLLWSFFFGLILGSALVIFKKINNWNLLIIISCLTGITLGYYISIAVPMETSKALWSVFLSGTVAICAMILPGISGSFILVLLGKYKFILLSVKNFNFPVIISFISGAFTGLLSFSHILNWMLKHYYNITISFLTGIMLGSLNKIWPWKQVISTYTTSKGEIKPLIEQNILPFNYYDITGGEPYILTSLILASIGFIFVILIVRKVRSR